MNPIVSKQLQMMMSLTLRPRPRYLPSSTSNSRTILKFSQLTQLTQFTLVKNSHPSQQIRIRHLQTSRQARLRPISPPHAEAWRRSWERIPDTPNEAKRLTDGERACLLWGIFIGVVGSWELRNYVFVDYIEEEWKAGERGDHVADKIKTWWKKFITVVKDMDLRGESQITYRYDSEVKPESKSNTPVRPLTKSKSGEAEVLTAGVIIAMALLGVVAGGLGWMSWQHFESSTRNME